MGYKIVNGCALNVTNFLLHLDGRLHRDHQQSKTILRLRCGLHKSAVCLRAGVLNAGCVYSWGHQLVRPHKGTLQQNVSMDVSRDTDMQSGWCIGIMFASHERKWREHGSQKLKSMQRLTDECTTKKWTNWILSPQLDSTNNPVEKIEQVSSKSFCRDTRIPVVCFLSGEEIEKRKENSCVHAWQPFVETITRKFG